MEVCKYSMPTSTIMNISAEKCMAKIASLIKSSHAFSKGKEK